MSDPIWYYARGESEQGPISTAQIKALAATGALRRDDLVWKEGMDNWLPASDIDELFPGQKKKNGVKKDETFKTEEEETPKDRPRLSRPITSADIDVNQLARWVGRALVVLGVLIVLMSRGCDSLGERKVARLQAIAESPGSEAVEADQLESQRTAATRAASQNRMWGYWRHLGFLFGTMALAVGLLCVTSTTDGPERWISLVMLAVILYSVYSSNSVWNGSS
jgi:hypothetical protein